MLELTTDIEVVDYHTGGEPFRIVLAGAPALEGSSVLDKRDHAIAELDQVRALLVNEPRGHADMYGCFVTEPNDDDGDIGVVFFHKDGFSTACGHGTIALVTWALNSGMLPKEAPVTSVVVDVPSGRLRTEAHLVGDRVVSVRFWNVPSFVTATERPISTSRGPFAVDIAFGGAFYASVSLDGRDLSVNPAHVDHLKNLGREIKALLAGSEAVRHPTDNRLSGLYGVIFHEVIAERHQRNVTVFADGEIDRSPCGSGTSARLAILTETGRLAVGDTLIHDSIIGSRFLGTVEGRTDAGTLTSIEGAAFQTGRASFSLDSEDPLGVGFQLR